MQKFEKISGEAIIRYLRHATPAHSCTQPKLSIPLINRIFQKMKNGIPFDAVEVNGSLIVDGHHRYLASCLAGVDVPFSACPIQSEPSIYMWSEVVFDATDYDSAADIARWNRRDADINNVSIDDLTALTS